MSKYISHTEHLKLMMNLLKDKSRNIQFEAFHVFKVCDKMYDVDMGAGCDACFAVLRFSLPIQTRPRRYWIY